jgi:hypothetical protein
MSRSLERSFLICALIAALLFPVVVSATGCTADSGVGQLHVDAGAKRLRLHWVVGQAVIASETWNCFGDHWRWNAGTDQWDLRITTAAGEPLFSQTLASAAAPVPTACEGFGTPGSTAGMR